jgi:hypothetical protein
MALLGMAAQATNRALSRRTSDATLAAMGATLFVISDSVLAFQRFRHGVEWGRFIVLGTYFAAQGGITLSVLLHREQRQGAASSCGNGMGGASTALSASMTSTETLQRLTSSKRKSPGGKKLSLQ